MSRMDGYSSIGGASLSGLSKLKATSLSVRDNTVLSGSVSITGNTSMANVSMSGLTSLANTIITGSLTANSANIISSSNTGGDTGISLLRFNTPRAWDFMHVNADGNSELSLVPNVGGKRFNICYGSIPNSSNNIATFYSSVANGPTIDLKPNLMTITGNTTFSGTNTSFTKNIIVSGNTYLGGNTTISTTGEVSSNTAVFTSKITLGTTDDTANKELLRLKIGGGIRDWVFEQDNTGASAGLRLRPIVGAKSFYVSNVGRTNFMAVGGINDDITHYANTNLANVSVSGLTSLGSVVGDRINLYSNTYGFGISSSQLNAYYPTSASFRLYSGGNNNSGSQVFAASNTAISLDRTTTATTLKQSTPSVISYRANNAGEVIASGGSPKEMPWDVELYDDSVISYSANTFTNSDSITRTVMVSYTIVWDANGQPASTRESYILPSATCSPDDTYRIARASVQTASGTNDTSIGGSCIIKMPASATFKVYVYQDSGANATATANSHIQIVAI